MKWTFDIASNLQVIGQNSENADFDNPRGDIVGEVWFVTATNEAGEVFSHALPGEWKRHNDEESGASISEHPSIGPNGKIAAEAELSIILKIGGNPDLHPLAWDFWRTVYGSPAYLNEVANQSDFERADEGSFELF